MLAAAPAHAEGDWRNFVLADRLEYQHEAREWLWDLQGWAGGDETKLWWKTEGHGASGHLASAEVQLLYSKAVSPFFDVQFGLRHDLEPGTGPAYAVIGLQGLAPQWFEVDAAAFLSEDGDLSGRLEVEYDLLLTQRLVLQPRLEFNLGDAFTETELGVRLRFEIRRKIAPYLGVSWQVDHRRDDDTLSLVAGARFWF
jgi:copper resistance protein B